MYTEHSLPATVRESTSLMLEQRTKGIAKYGKPLEEAGLSAKQLLQHAREEMADGSVYLAALQAQLNSDLAREYNRALHDVHDLLKAAGLMNEDISNAILATLMSPVRTALRVYLPQDYDTHLKEGRNMIYVCRDRVAQYTVPTDILLP